MQKREIDANTNQLNVAQTRTAGFYVFIAKLYLEKFPTVELHSIGYAMNVAIKVADILNK